MIILKYFKTKKLVNYINYYNKYPTITTNDLIFIINNDLDSLVYNDFTKELMHHKSFKEDRMNRYNDYNNKYKLQLEETVFAVNNDFDLYNIKFKNNYKKYMKRNYYIISNVERYAKYSDSNKNLDIDEVISHVNSNKDLNIYTKNKKANTSLGNTILVNKYYYLDNTYIPNDLVNIEEQYGIGSLNKEAYEAFKLMSTNSTIPLYIINGYISYDEQTILYNSNNKYFDKPGYSENQTGLIIEIQNSEFIQRYPKDKKELTGYDRPNYYRYVGKEISEFIHKNNITYEEYYAYFIENK